MKFNRRKSTEDPVRLAAIAVAARGPQAAPAPRRETPAPAWWQRPVLALGLAWFGTPKKRGFDDRRSRSFPVPCLAGSEARVPAPTATIAAGPSARVIQFPQQARRRMP